MANTWTKECPQVEGYYWWRTDSGDIAPDIHQVSGERFYQIGERDGSITANYGGEWLGPFTASNFEQLAALREAARNAECVLTNVGRGVEALEPQARDAASALREALKEK